jgi:hypothetical protein
MDDKDANATIPVRMTTTTRDDEGTFSAGQTYRLTAAKALAFELIEAAEILERRKVTAEEQKSALRLAFDWCEAFRASRGIETTNAERVPYLRRVLERIEKAALAA